MILLGFWKIFLSLTYTSSAKCRASLAGALPGTRLAFSRKIGISLWICRLLLIQMSSMNIATKSLKQAIKVHSADKTKIYFIKVIKFTLLFECTPPPSVIHLSLFAKIVIGE